MPTVYRSLSAAAKDLLIAEGMSLARRIAADRDLIRPAVELGLDPGPGLRGLCALKAGALWFVMLKAALPALLQAGSCFWRRTPVGAAEGEFEFGYQFHAGEAARRLTLGGLPELHAWVAIPRWGCVVDPSSGDFPEQCRRIEGKPWPGRRPPSYFWGTAADCRRQGCCYLADPRAGRIVEAVVASLLTDRPIVLRVERGHLPDGGRGPGPDQL